MEVGKYLENLKTDCLILFLSQMIHEWFSPLIRRERGAWLRKEELEFGHSSRAGLCFVVVRGEDRGQGKDTQKQRVVLTNRNILFSIILSCISSSWEVGVVHFLPWC